MKYSYEKYILPSWVLTMEDYRAYAPHAGASEPSIQAEPTPMGRLEIEHRIAQVAANKAEAGQVKQEYNVSEPRHSAAVYRCRGNGGHRRGYAAGHE